MILKPNVGDIVCNGGYGGVFRSCVLQHALQGHLSLAWLACPAVRGEKSNNHDSCTSI
jgi:hypothetical protein